MIKSKPFYWVECDECGTSAQEESDYSAWGDAGAAIDTAHDADWIVRDGLHLCAECGYRKVCKDEDDECVRRDVTEADDGWMYCPEHISQGMDENPTPPGVSDEFRSTLHDGGEGR